MRFCLNIHFVVTIQQTRKRKKNKKTQIEDTTNRKGKTHKKIFFFIFFVYCFNLDHSKTKKGKHNVQVELE